MNERPILVNDLILTTIAGLRKADLPEDETQVIRDLLWKAWGKAYQAEESKRLKEALASQPSL